jgi:hypothetical protein
MVQDLLNPQSVEGWHTGVEWINSGSLMQRVNFTAGLVGDVSRPGIKTILDRLQTQGPDQPPGVTAASTCSPLSLPRAAGADRFLKEGGDFRGTLRAHPDLHGPWPSSCS